MQLHGSYRNFCLMIVGDTGTSKKKQEESKASAEQIIYLFSKHTLESRSTKALASFSVCLALEAGWQTEQQHWWGMPGHR